MPQSGTAPPGDDVLVDGASVVVVTPVAADAGAVDVVDELAAEDGADEVVVDEEAEDDVVEVARFTEVEVVESPLEALSLSMTPVSRNPMNAPAPTMARRTRPAANLLILVLLSNLPFVDTTS